MDSEGENQHAVSPYLQRRLRSHEEVLADQASDLKDQASRERGTDAMSMNTRKEAS